MLARLTTRTELGAETLTHFWPSHERSSRSAAQVAPVFRAQVCTGHRRAGRRRGQAWRGQRGRRRRKPPPPPWGARGGQRDTKHSGNTQIRTSRLTRWMRWYHRASSYAVGQSEALTTPHMRQATGLSGRQPKALPYGLVTV